MINYCTRVEIGKSSFEIRYQDRLMYMGSCFAEQIGLKMREHGWNVCVNPFGVLYNPLSVAAGCKRILQPDPFTEADLFHHNGMAHSYMHHGKFSGQLSAVALSRMNEALSEAAETISRISYLVITFGTASVYRLKSDGSLVANCHKMPAVHFNRDLLTVGQIVDEWSDLFDRLREINPLIRVIFTVSPIRHWKDGAHLNQISKSILLLAEHALIEKYADMAAYFPAYELMMDELRDYRFYADDLLHPSTVAIDYIWERFCDAYMNDATKNDLKEMESILKDRLHRPFNPSSEAYRHFLEQTMSKIKRLQKKNQYICTSIAEKDIADRLRSLSLSEINEKNNTAGKNV